MLCEVKYTKKVISFDNIYVWYISRVVQKHFKKIIMYRSRAL